MAYYDDERKIIDSFCGCDDNEILLFSNKSEEIIQKIRDIKKWHCSSGKADPPPDFYSVVYGLMMEVMRIDDHAYTNRKGRTINPYLEKENKTYKEIKQLLADNGISFSGDIIVNTSTELPTSKDHSYDKYVANFQRVLNKHNSSNNLYRKNHGDCKLVFFILDESSPYMEIGRIREKVLSAGDIIQARPHLFFLDKRMVDVLKQSKADYYVWYAPYKHFDSLEGLELPKIIIYSKEDLVTIGTRNYINERMQSVEK